MQQADLDRFKTWLTVYGAKVVALHANEVLRFRHGKRNGVVTRKKNGGLDPTPVAAHYFEAFLDKRPMPNKPVRRSNEIPSAIEIVFSRDGATCFYCDKPLGADVTREHLLSRSHGGATHPANLVLAHKRCNNDARNCAIVEKIKLRDDLRTGGRSHS